MATSKNNTRKPLLVVNDYISSEPKTECKSDVFSYTDTAAKKQKNRRNYVIALIVVLIIIIGILSSILILQNVEQEHRERAQTNQRQLVCPNKPFSTIDIKSRDTSENIHRRYLICFSSNHDNAPKTDKSVYIVAERDFELNIFKKDLDSTSTYIEVNTKMAKVKKMNVPYTMMLSYFKAEKKAILIETTLDAAVIIIDNYKLSSDSTMVLPVKHLSDTYIISSVEYFNRKYHRVQFAIAALNNSTEVRIIFRIEHNLTLSVDGVEYQDGSEMVIALNELETYQIRHNADLSGTFIKASSNIAVFSGNSCQKIAFKNRNNSGACSQLVEQIPPVDRLDNTYIAPPNINRYGTILKVVSPFKSRVTYRVGNKKTRVSLVPQGYFEFSITENEVAVIESERPVLLTSFATGSDTSGDPYMITIPGVTQYLNKYTVITPSNFTSNYIVLIIEESSLPHLNLNKRGLTEYIRTFHTPVTVGKVRYIVLGVHVSDGTINVKTTNNAVFGLLVYGHRKNDGHGFAGNVVLPDTCVP
ncbi:IgGFc-binding protein-like [Ostrea edulis]|uniref:IgGFc-binding protein-like n=1 Tax=Ostrea edulis TaxID=37623 RepID=UPI0024AF75E3|nr:IgGFc-binding protein-like [Ostrea edulis]XP_056002153.1 IgGFc-binding protein-like [Ostrea edulis]